MHGTTIKIFKKCVIGLKTECRLTFMGKPLSFVTIRDMFIPKQCQRVTESLPVCEASIVSYVSYRNCIGIASQIASCMTATLSF